MIALDLDGPYDQFVERLEDIKRMVCCIEAAYRNNAALTTARTGVDLALIGPATSVNANSMALVFLASSYEEFMREEISECARLLAVKYHGLDVGTRQLVRNSYWGSTMQRLSNSKNILTSGAPGLPRSLDATVLGKIAKLLDIAQLFVVSDNPAQLDKITMVQHKNNFRPKVVDEIVARLGIQNFTRRIADEARVRTYFGVSTGAEAAKLLTPKIDDFYDKRNEIVHSLSSTAGYGVDYVIDWITAFEIFADSSRKSFKRITGAW